MPQTYNVLVTAEFNNIAEEALKEILERLEEHGVERIPTVSSAWEISCEAEYETEAKEKAIEIFVNVCRTYPFELKMVVQCGASRILRRKKVFES